MLLHIRCKNMSLCDKPHLIYNVDEKGINTGGGKPPHIVTSRNKIAPVVTPERSQTVLNILKKMLLHIRCKNISIGIFCITNSSITARYSPIHQFR
jgi:hypothetical protein